jgi:hypothetical protein
VTSASTFVSPRDARTSRIWPTSSQRLGEEDSEDEVAVEEELARVQ